MPDELSGLWLKYILNADHKALQELRKRMLPQLHHDVQAAADRQYPAIMLEPSAMNQVALDAWKSAIGVDLETAPKGTRELQQRLLAAVEHLVTQLRNEFVHDLPGEPPSEGLTRIKGAEMRGRYSIEPPESKEVSGQGGSTAGGASSSGQGLFIPTQLVAVPQPEVRDPAQLDPTYEQAAGDLYSELDVEEDGNVEVEDDPPPPGQVVAGEAHLGASASVTQTSPTSVVKPVPFYGGGEATPDDDPDLALDLVITGPEGMTEAELATEAEEIAAELDRLYRALGGNGLTVQDVEITSDEVVPEEVR